MSTTVMRAVVDAVTSCAYTVFTECSVAVYSVKVPASPSPAFTGVQQPVGPAHVGSVIVIEEGPCQ